MWSPFSFMTMLITLSYDAHHVFITLAGYTSAREVDVQWVAEGAMRLPVPQ